MTSRRTRPTSPPTSLVTRIAQFLPLRSGRSCNNRRAIWRAMSNALLSSLTSCPHSSAIVFEINKVKVITRHNFCAHPQTSSLRSRRTPSWTLSPQQISVRPFHCAFTRPLPAVATAVFNACWSRAISPGQPFWRSTAAPFRGCPSTVHPSGSLSSRLCLGVDRLWLFLCS